MATYKKKLIEVSLPLPEVNDASSYDKMPGIGAHPKGIHHWWARLPLPTARAVLFTSVVDDPSEHPEKFPTEAKQNAERERLFGIVRRMMQKKLHTRPEVYREATGEMLRSCNGHLPALFDPFAGGGSIPLEGARLGFEVHAADLNPVAVLLNKCNLEIVPTWVGKPPVNPRARKKIGGTDPWPGARGLAEDVRYYGDVVRARAIETIGHLYPKVPIPAEYGGGEGNVIAWIWARTVASEDAALGGKHVPLISSYWLSRKKGALAWLEPSVDRASGTYCFKVNTSVPSDGEVVARGTKLKKGGFLCLLTGTPITFKHVRKEGEAGRLGKTLIATIVDTPSGRIFLPAVPAQEAIAGQAVPVGFPDTDLPGEALGFRVQKYGIKKHWQMFTPRQLHAMVTLSDLIRGVFHEIQREARLASLAEEQAVRYAQAVVTFLALALDRCAAYNNMFCRWNGGQTVSIFTQQVIAMLWDFSEANLMGEEAVCWRTAVEITAEAVETIPTDYLPQSSISQCDAASGAHGLTNILVSTDPPYYDNIGYAALSDFFYVWLRRTLANVQPGMFDTLLAPKVPELTASPERFDGDKHKAKEHFEAGFRKAFTDLRGAMASAYPLTVYYAFKQDDQQSEEVDANAGAVVDLTTGWETLLEALVSSGFQITATWPVRASFSWRVRAQESNALASYIVLACRPRPLDAHQSGRREFLVELRKELPIALRRLQQGNVAPVDFAQAAIGPGMAIYSRYSRILESSGTPLSVRSALNLINQVKDEILGEAESEYDPYTRWAIAWYEQHGFEVGEFGDANTLANAHAVAVSAIRDAGLVKSGEGEVRLLKPEELDKEWEPEDESRRSIWRMTHQLVRRYFVDKVGDMETAALLRQLGPAGESARDLAYRLFSIAERRKRSLDAQSYNALVLGWPEISRLAQSAPSTSSQAELL